MKTDFLILDFIQAHLRTDFLDKFFSVTTHLGDGGILWILLALVMIISVKYRKKGLSLASALIIEAVICNLLIKPLAARVRPYDINTAVQILIQKPKDYSFPSGHTGASFAAASALFFSKDRLWIPVALLAILIAYSRLYLYVHYPSDVLAGMILGIISGFAGSGAVKKIFKSKDSENLKHA